MLVIENGEVYRVKGNFYFRCREVHIGRGGRYKCVSYSKNGKQKHVYIHRLVAKAFVPNPENKPQVNHKDGDPRNNSPDNLEWVTAKENIVHAHETGLIRTLKNTPHNCIKCKGPAMKNGSLCAKCKYDLRALKGKLLSIQRQRNKYRNIDTSNLKPLYRNIIKSRFRGDTLQEIGDRTGVTREYIRQLEKRVFDKDSIVYMVKKKDTKKRFKTEAKPFLITIKAARVNADIKVDEASEKAGITRETLYRWESYKNKIPFVKFIKLCELYNAPPENINGYKEGDWFVPTYRKG